MKIKIRDIYNFIGVFLLCALYFFETPISLLGTQLLIVLQIGITLCFIMAASVHGRIIVMCRLKSLLVKNNQRK